MPDEKEREQMGLPELFLTKRRGGGSTILIREDFFGTYPPDRSDLVAAFNFSIYADKKRTFQKEKGIEFQHGPGFQILPILVE